MAARITWDISYSATLARTINWGDSSGTNWVTGTGNGTAQPHTVYARIAASEFSPQGSYTDTITASIIGNFAGTQSTAVFSVTATVVPGCAVAATSQFWRLRGHSDQLHISHLGQCSNALAYNIGLNAGTATGATVTNRKMTGPGRERLTYRLCRNSSRTQNWGNTVGVDTCPAMEPAVPSSCSSSDNCRTVSQSGREITADTITATVTF